MISFSKKRTKKNPYFYSNVQRKDAEPHKKLLGYDYGILPDFYDPSLFDISTRKHEMAGKMIKYLEAGLPVIMNKQLTFMADLVDQYGIGINIDFNDLKSLRKILKKTDYGTLQKNIKKFQEEFRLSKTIKKLEGFYEKVVKNYGGG